MMTSDLPGAVLSEQFFRAVVAPLLEERRPRLAWAAGRLGSGSDVLGFDDAQSRDHDWGLRLTILLEDAAVDEVAEVDALLEGELPETWAGHPVRFATTWDPAVRQRCEVASTSGFVRSRLGFDAAGTIQIPDWLSLTGQSVLEVTAGPVFHDGAGELTAARGHLAWYPRDLWLYVLACDWMRLADELPDVGRAGLRGDDDGSAVIAVRHVRTMMHLAHLLHRRWAPYGKWLARSTARLPGGGALRAAIGAVLRAGDWRERQEALAGAVELLGAQQAAAGLAGVEPATEPFFDRPHVGVRETMIEDLLAQIGDPAVRALPRGQGSAEQISDNVKVLVDPLARRRLVGADPAGS